MTRVLLQQPLAPEEIKSLKGEFPNYTFVLLKPGTELPLEDWADIEILYGSHLQTTELAAAKRLRWIHVPGTSLRKLCVKEIEETTNLLVTNTKDPDVHQMAEYAIGMALAFGKHLFDWQALQGDPHDLWESPYRELMWSFKERTWLQIGLGQVGTAILEQAKNLHMRTWGLQEHASFHPHCQKTFSAHELHSLLPAADVVSIAIPRGEIVPLLLKRDQIELIKRDSILIIIGSEGVIEEKALLDLADQGHFRGVAIDAILTRKSPLFFSNNVLVTPSVAGSPEPLIRLEYRQFLHNFRRYIHNDFDSMKNLLRTRSL